MGEWDSIGVERVVRLAETDRGNWKNGDWLCPNDTCRNHNYATNERCRLCQVRKAGNSEFISCKFFVGDGCTYGENCRFQHITVDEYIREQFATRHRSDGKGVRAGSVERRTGGGKGGGVPMGRGTRDAKWSGWDEDESEEEAVWEDPYTETRKGRGKRVRSVSRAREHHRQASLVARTGKKGTGKGKATSSEAKDEKDVKGQEQEPGEECGSLLEEMLDEFMEELDSTCKKWRKSLGDRIRSEITTAKKASTATASGTVKEEEKPVEDIS